MTKDLDWQTEHNLDAFNDLLRGCFGIYEYKEPVKIKLFGKSYDDNPLNDFDTEFFELYEKENLQQIQVDFIRKQKGIYRQMTRETKPEPLTRVLRQAG